jgi:hypothetical protein
VREASDETVTDQTRLCALRAGDRDVLLLFKKRDARHGRDWITPYRLRDWPCWSGSMGGIEQKKKWQYGGEALYFCDPDGNLLEVVTPGVWSIY